MQPAWGGGGGAAEGRKKGRLGKQSLYSRLSPARPGRAALAGASYVMWLAGPTSLFRAAAHTNPHWGTSPALEEEEEETEGELWGERWKKVWLQEFGPFICTESNMQTAPPSQPLCWKITARIISALAEPCVFTEQICTEKSQHWTFTVIFHPIVLRTVISRVVVHRSPSVPWYLGLNVPTNHKAVILTSQTKRLSPFLCECIGTETSWIPLVSSC